MSNRWFFWLEPKMQSLRYPEALFFIARYISYMPLTSLAYHASFARLFFFLKVTPHAARSTTPPKKMAP